MAELWQFNGYAYPKSQIEDWNRDIEAKTRFGDNPGRHGQYTQGGLIAPRKVVLKGHLIPEGGDVLDTLWDSFLSKHIPGTISTLYLGRDDRYITAEVTGLGEVSASDYPLSRPWEVHYVASDPAFYAATATGPTDITAGGVVVANAGDLETKPTLVVVLSALGTSGTLTLTNAASGKSLVLAMPGALTTLTLDMALEKVTNTGGADVTNLVSSGVFWGLLPGNNTLNRTWGGSANASSINATHRGRWL